MQVSIESILYQEPEMSQLKLEKRVNLANTKITQMSELSDKDFKAATKNNYKHTCNK